MNKAFTLAFCVLALAAADISFACVKPASPSCMDVSAGFKSEAEYNVCKADVERYIEESKQYAKCTVDEQQKNINTILEKFNDRVHKTNRK